MATADSGPGQNRIWQWPGPIAAIVLAVKASLYYLFLFGLCDQAGSIKRDPEAFRMLVAAIALLGPLALAFNVVKRCSAGASPLASRVKLFSVVAVPLLAASFAVFALFAH